MQNIANLLDFVTPLSVLGDFFIGWTPVAIVLLIVGLVLVIIEMVLPGFGIPGISGVICLIVAIVLRSNTVTDALLTIALIFIVLAAAAVVVFVGFSRTAFKNSPLSLSDTIESNSSSLGDAAAQEMVGKMGVTLSDLRPAGIATIGNKRYDVMTEGEFIGVGCEIVVYKVEGIKIIVRAA